MSIHVKDLKDLPRTKDGALSYAGLYKGRELVKGLYIGSVVDSVNRDFFKKHNIKVVFNCSKDIPFSIPGTVKIRLPVDDSPDEVVHLFNLWKKAVPLMDKHIRAGRACLIHCRAGQQRSCSSCAAYIMCKKGWSAKKTKAFIKAKKDDAGWPTWHFARSLTLWEEYLKKHPNLCSPTPNKPTSRAKSPSKK